MSDVVMRRRWCAAVFAVLLLGAGLPLLLSGSASAASPFTSIAISPLGASGAAGNCTTFTVTASGGAMGATITVNIDENGSSATQDVDFCTVPDITTPLDGLNGEKQASYDNGNVGPGRSPYTPGRTVTSSSTAPESPSLADDSSNASQTQADPSPKPTTNPSGIDSLRYTFQGKPIVVGVTGLTMGSAGVVAFVDEQSTTTMQTNSLPDDGEVASPRALLTLTEGGLPGTQAVADAADIVDATPEDAAAAQGTVQDIAVSVRNEPGDPLFGVTPSLVVARGPNSSTFDQLRADCSATDNSGRTTCRYQGRNLGTDTLIVYVNRSGGTAGPDASEPQDEITRGTFAAGQAGAARLVDIFPESAVTSPGETRSFFAHVTDLGGTSVAGVTVTFTESGPGEFEPDGRSPRTVVTDSTGRAVVTVRTSASDSGVQTVSAAISATSTDCEEPVDRPLGAPAGRCVDTATNQVTASPSPSPSPSQRVSASPTPSATATATMSPIATPSRSATPSPTRGPDCSVTPTVTLNPSTIIATGSAGVTVNAPANSRIELLAYSQPSTAYRVVREATIDASGNPAQFRVVPPTNTRLYAEIVGCTTDETRFSRVLNVRTQLSMNVVRNGKQDYTFSGSAIPARPRGLIVSLYRVTDEGRQILTAQTRANANVGQAGYDPSRKAGSYTIRRVFTGTGRFGFVVRTGQDLQNAPGSSNVRSLLVF